VTSVVFDRAADYYDRTRGYPDGVTEQVADLLCSVGALGARSQVLELGVGTGRIALPLATRVGCMVGVDRSRPMLDRLLQKPGARDVHSVLADICALPFAPERFDAVLAVHVFHLVPNWQQALAEVRRVLLPGGVLLLVTDDWPLRELWLAARAGLPQHVSAGVPQTDFEFPTRAGFRTTGAPSELRYRVTVDFRVFMQQIEDRVWSSTWDLSDDALRELIAGMRRAILERYADLGAIIELERSVTVRAFSIDP
jgi:SAM-dependent methyltransferase